MKERRVVNTPAQRYKGDCMESGQFALEKHPKCPFAV
jgi:hypothetical protein